MNILVNNNRSYIKFLAKSCMRANRGRNVIAGAAVILTGLLFTALATVFAGSEITMRNQMLRQSGSRFMVSLKYLTKEDVGRLKESGVFSVMGVERYVGNAVNEELAGMNAAVGWVDETAAAYSFKELTGGNYPTAADEIACDTEVLRLLGLPPETGTTFVLKYTVGEKLLEKTMTVCGVFPGMKYGQSASLLVSEQFVEEALPEYEGVYEKLRALSYDVRGSFSNESRIEEKLKEVVRMLGYDPDAARGESGFLIHHVSPAFEIREEDGKERLLYYGTGTFLILLAGYLIIYNIFKISVDRDIRLYGQLKTVGMSPRQIRCMVKRQGLLLAAAGIPAGLVLGWLTGNGLLPLMMASTSYQDISFIVPPVPAWLLSGLFTLATVLISCGRPGRIAGKIAPVEALRYSGAAVYRRKRKRGKESRFRIFSMACANMGRNRGKTALVVLSISLCSVLLNSVLNYTGSMDMEAYVRRSVISDFDVRSLDYLKSSAESDKKVVPAAAVSLLQELAGVERFSKVYCNMLPEGELTDRQEDLGKVLTVRRGGEETEAERERMLLGYDENACSRARLIEGSIDYALLCTGDYVLVEGFLSDGGEYLSYANEFHAGDVIQVEIAGAVETYTVMAVVGGADGLNMSYSKGGYEALVFAEPVFLEKFPAMQTPVHCLFDASSDSFADVNAAVSAVAKQRGLSVVSRLTAEEEFREMRRTRSMSGLIVSLILGVIGVLNLVNVIMTGVIARKTEFLTMQSIGMSRRQLRRLVVYEGAVCAVLAGLIGIAVSSVLSVTLVKGLVSDIWYMRYHFTVLPAAVVSAVCILLSASVSALTDILWNKSGVSGRTE